MTQSQPPITRTTHTLPLDKLSPRDFERLCLWVVERDGYKRAEHLGAVGGERRLKWKWGQKGEQLDEDHYERPRMYLRGV